MELLSSSFVERRYVSAGRYYGDAVSYIYMGESGNMEQLLNIWAKWEKEYARRGFRTVSLDRFVEFGGYDRPINDIIGKRREEGEKPILYAQIYLEKFLGKFKPVVSVDEMIQHPTFRKYDIPSTEQDK